MLRSARVVLAILVVLGSLSAGAFARDGGRGADGGAAGSRGDNFGRGFGGTYGTGGLRGEFRGYRRHDVWGHWGAYYGPMIPMI
jgi:hypothetical protein